MKNSIGVLFAVALGLFSTLALFGQSRASSLSGYRYAVVPLVTFDNGKVDPYGLSQQLRRRIAADPSWQLLTDVEVTTQRGAGALWPAELPWQIVASSALIAQDKIKLAQTASLSIYTPGGRGRIEVGIAVSDVLGREIARFEGVSGVFGTPRDRMLNALDKALAMLSGARPQFQPDPAIAAAPDRSTLNESQLRSYLAAAPELSPIEGIWSDRDGTFRLGITRDQGTSQFLAVVLASNHPFWDIGMIKARFEPTADPNNLIGHYRLDDHREQTVAFRVERGSLMSEGAQGVRLLRLDTGDARPGEVLLSPPSAAASASPPAATAPPPVAAPAQSQAGALHRIGTGTAFVVGPSLVATNFHVIDGGTAWELRFPPTDQAWPLDLVIADKANDLAIMRIRGTAPARTPLSVVESRTARLGEDVYSVGFPLTGLLSDGHKVSTGVVSGLAGLDNDPRFFQLTVPTQPGNSGGPIFNNKGEVVGVLASTLSVDFLYKATRAVPQNVNFALKSDYLLLLMTQVGSVTPVAKVNPTSVTRVDQIADAQASIGLLSTFGAEPRPKTLDTSRSSDAVTPPEVPVLEVAYRHPSGPQILVRQRGATATITFYRADASIYGNASVSWRSDSHGFVGVAEVPYVCGPVDTRVTTVRSQLELFLESGGTLRMRLQVASGINCSRNRVDLRWGEDRWYPQ